MGRILSLVFSLFGVFVGSAAGTWWFNTIAIGLFLRWAERYRVVREGSLKTCFCILFGIWVIFSAATIGIVVLAFFLLRSALSDWLEATLPTSLFNAGFVVVLICIGLAVIFGMGAGLSEVMGAAGAAKRRRFLFNPNGSSPPCPPVQDVDIPAGGDQAAASLFCAMAPPIDLTIFPMASLSRQISGNFRKSYATTILRRSGTKPE